jgi:DNA-binding FadR family transcriptional regulator
MSALDHFETTPAIRQRYQQIADHLVDDMRSARLGPGERLPAVRGRPAPEVQRLLHVMAESAAPVQRLRWSGADRYFHRQIAVMSERAELHARNHIQRPRRCMALD